MMQADIVLQLSQHIGMEDQLKLLLAEFLLQGLQYIPRHIEEVLST